MRRSYEFPLHFQEGWSSLQTRLRSPRDRHRGSSLQTGRLGIFRGTTTSRMCSKNLSIAPTCRSWVSSQLIWRASGVPAAWRPPEVVPRNLGALFARGSGFGGQSFQLFGSEDDLHGMPESLRVTHA